MPNPLKRVKDLASITVRGRDYDLAEELRIDPDDLQTAFLEQAEKYAFWARLHRRELAVLREKEEAAESTRQLYFRQVWEELENRGTKPYDALVWSIVYNADEPAEARREVRRLKRIVEDLRSVVDALEHRKSSLINLGASSRRENEVLTVNKGRKHG
jgi:hypothetical protein